MPGFSGTIADDAFELTNLFLTAIDDLPFDGFFALASVSGVRESEVGYTGTIFDS